MNEDTTITTTTTTTTTTLTTTTAVFTGCSSFLHHSLLASHDLATIWQRKLTKNPNFKEALSEIKVLGSLSTNWIKFLH